MKVIRGAIDIKANSIEDIETGTEELISAILKENNIEVIDIEAIFFSATKDIDSAYPAKAARNMGIKAALMCFQEMEVRNSMRKCLRIAVFINKDIEIKPVYLGKAKSLRPDLFIYQIAVDGPAGSGKSTVSKIIADKLDIIYIDTGAMYRAITYAALKEGINLSDEKAVSDLSDRIKIDFKNKSIFLNGINVDREIRENIISKNVSIVSMYSAVRKKMVDLQRNMATEKSVIMDGRDIGTVVFPNAKYKIFLEASAEVRGKRRYDELKLRGEEDISLEKIIEEISLRDKLDSQREISPLKKAEDATIINSDNLSIDGVVEKIVEMVKKDVL